MLIEDFYEDFTLLTPVMVSDGEGGSTTTWYETTKFFAAAVKDTSPEMRAAERAGSKPEYTLTVSEHTPVNIAYHDVFKRGSCSCQCSGASARGPTGSRRADAGAR